MIPVDISIGDRTEIYSTDFGTIRIVETNSNNNNYYYYNNKVSGSNVLVKVTICYSGIF